MIVFDRVYLLYALIGAFVVVLTALFYISYLQYQENVNRFTTVRTHVEATYAANELSSYAKRAEGHMLIYLILHNQRDRDKFYLRLQKTKEIQRMLSESMAGDEDSTSILNSINTNVDSLLHQGNLLLEIIDKGEAISERGDALVEFHRLSSEIRKQGVSLVPQFTKELNTFNKHSSNMFHRFLIFLISSVVIVIMLVIFILTYSKRLYLAERRAKELEQQFLQAQKMEAMGILVGGIAHDFNNTLGAIQGNLFLAKRKLDEKDELISKLENVEELSTRAADMVQQLLTFARKDVVSIRPLSLTSFMKEEFKLSTSIIPKNISYNSVLCDADLIIRADATQLQQALINLLNNARDAVCNAVNPKITCKLEPININADFRQRHPEFKGERVAHLSVEDNGHGISEDALEKIFLPFFTTKGVGKGTGLGLAMVYGSVQTHGGTIEVESKQNRGTTFHIYLPLSKDDEINIESQDQSISPGKGETILLVDDDVDILEATGEAIRDLGYKVLLAEDGEVAVEVFKNNFKDVSLVISDLVMPNMGGAEAVKKMRLLNSKIPVIFATGYDKNQAIASFKGLDGYTMTAKPFAIEALSHTIRKLIKRELID